MATESHFGPADQISFFKVDRVTLTYEMVLFPTLFAILRLGKRHLTISPLVQNRNETGIFYASFFPGLESGDRNFSSKFVEYLWHAIHLLRPTQQDPHNVL